ncbi:MAG TPA: hypothetical protein G4O15_01600 [Dehalococcoidia bacterium]|nr:hypothetical protein [Dehalococcoidia bacterium]
MNRDGSRTSTGKKWGKTTEYKVLTNEVYKGILVWGDRIVHGRMRRGESPIRVDNS